MIIVTSDSIPGKKIVKTFGLVRGNTIRARHLGRDIMAGLRTLVGGEIMEYTKGLRFTTSVIMGGSAELLSYGTAVYVEEK